MNPTPIDWCDYSWNPVTGCLNGCSYCYARRLAEGRLAHLYPRGFEPTFWPGRLRQPLAVREPSRIFAVSMGDMFSEGAEWGWADQVLESIQEARQHTFVVLTKRPDRAREYVDRRQDPLPPNLWLGVTVEEDRFAHRVEDLVQIPAAVRLVSCEPLMGMVNLSPWLDRGLIHWVIFGGMTGRPYPVLTMTVGTLLDQCKRTGTPVFLKANLGMKGPQEYPGPQRGMSDNGA